MKIITETNNNLCVSCMPGKIAASRISANDPPCEQFALPLLLLLLFRQANMPIDFHQIGVILPLLPVEADNIYLNFDKFLAHSSSHKYLHKRLFFGRALVLFFAPKPCKRHSQTAVPTEVI